MPSDKVNLCSSRHFQVNPRKRILVHDAKPTRQVAAQICHRIAVMHRGEVVEEGPTVQVFGAPAHPYTRALFDAAPGKNFAFG